MRSLRILEMVEELYNEAQNASPSPYRDGYLAALELAIEDIKAMLWDEAGYDQDP